MSLVCWSGGLDSTLVLHNLAIGQRDGLEFHKHGVRALTINHPQIGCCQRRAEKARWAVKAHFRRIGLTISYIEVTIEQTAQSWRTESFVIGSGNPQATLWLTIAANYLDNDENLYTGYIRGDDFWHRADLYCQAFGAIQRLAERGGGFTHPLEWTDKAEVIAQTKKLKLYDLCWWCEEIRPPRHNGRIVSCGKCASCITNDMGLWKLTRQESAC